jgi:hypothetical protein
MNFSTQRSFFLTRDYALFSTQPNRCDAVVGEGEGASEIVHEVRMALEYEYFSLTSSCEDDVLSRAVLLVHDDSMRLPIHLACDKNAPLSILRSLLVADTEKVSIGVPDKWGGESFGGAWAVRV